ncbi:MAG: diguanylate cyclase [Syntrophomonas sp.]
MRVLVADDDGLFRRALGDSLQKWGYEPVVCRDGNEAFTVLEQEDSPALVILDWTMPGMEGTEICRRIRSRNTPNYVYIILLTGKSDQEDVIKGLESGADDYIVKPFYTEELRSRLKVGRRIIELEQRILCMASTDYLTSLLNRRAFLERLEAEINRSVRESRNLGIIIADIDHFKSVNDNFGHQAGDLVLQEFARCLTSSFRIYDFIGRYGGEEFIIALPGASAAGAQVIVERVRKSVEGNITHIDDNNINIRVTASFGITALECGKPIIDIDGLIKQADTALYRAKDEGRNRVVVFKE